MTADTLRNASEDDLPRIVEIYNASIPGRLATADTQPVSVESRRAWFAVHGPDKHPLWVLERDGRIIAWASMQAYLTRPAYHRTAEVSVYVAPEAQGQGLGSLLLERLIAASPALGLKSLVALIFGHNAVSLRMFERAGFVTWGHLPKIAELDDVERDLVILGRKVAILAPRDEPCTSQAEAVTN